MSLGSRAKSFLSRAMKDTYPATITYTRGENSVSFTASVARTVFASQLDGKARLEFGEIDLIIDSADLVLGGSKTEPARGDRIAITLDGTAMTLELMIPSTREPSWRYSDPERTRIRLHLKRVS